MVRDAFGVLAPARPATLGFLCCFASSSLALAKMEKFVFAGPGNVPVGPSPMPSASNPKLFGRDNLAVRQPSEQSHPMDTNLLCSFFGRIRFHLCYRPIAHVLSRTKITTSKEPLQYHDLGYPKSPTRETALATRRAVLDRVQTPAQIDARRRQSKGVSLPFTFGYLRPRKKPWLREC